MLQFKKQSFLSLKLGERHSLSVELKLLKERALICMYDGLEPDTDFDFKFSLYNVQYICLNRDVHQIKCIDERESGCVKKYFLSKINTFFIIRLQTYCKAYLYHQWCGSSSPTIPVY